MQRSVLTGGFATERVNCRALRTWSAARSRMVSQRFALARPAPRRRLAGGGAGRPARRAAASPSAAGGGRMRVSPPPGRGAQHVGEGKLSCRGEFLLAGARGTQRRNLRRKWGGPRRAKPDPAPRRCPRHRRPVACGGTGPSAMTVGRSAGWNAFHATGPRFVDIPRSARSQGLYSQCHGSAL